MLLTRHTLHQTLLQMGVALQGPVSIALGREKVRGWSNFVNFVFPFHESGSGVIWRTFFFVFYNILWYSKVFTSWIYFFFFKLYRTLSSKK